MLERSEQQEWDDDALAIDFLRTRGFRLTNKYNWLVPELKEVISKDEHLAAGYLADEWDWGWFTRSLKEGEQVLG